MNIIGIGAHKMEQITQQEKKEFATRMKSDLIQNKLKIGRRYFRSGLFWSIGGAITIIIVLVFKIFRASFFLPLALFMWVDFSAADFYRFYKYAVKTVKIESMNRIRYIEYCRLEKTGELDKWSGEQTPNTQEQREKAALSIEEIALLKKIINEQEEKNSCDKL